jgi:hypothetical protein
MVSEFSKSIDTKRSTAVIEFLNESSKFESRLQLNSKFSNMKTSALPLINFDKQAVKLKSLSTKVSPRSVSDVSEITKAYQEIKRLD